MDVSADFVAGMGGFVIHPIALAAAGVRLPLLMNVVGLRFRKGLEIFRQTCAA